MSEFASEETMATDDELETPVEPESSVDGPSATASNDEDWED